MAGIHQYLFALILVSQEGILAPASNAEALVVLYKKIKKGCVFINLYVLLFKDLGDCKLRYPSSCGVASCVKYSSFMVSAFKSEGQHAVLGIEFHAFCNYLLDSVRTFVYKYVNRGFFTQASTCNEGIILVYFRSIILGCDCSYTALRIE